MDDAFGFITFPFFVVVKMMIFNLPFHFKPLCSYCLEPRKPICSLPVPQTPVILPYWDAQREKLHTISHLSSDYRVGHLMAINLLLNYFGKCGSKTTTTTTTKTRQENPCLLLHNKHGPDCNCMVLVRFKALWVLIIISGNGGGLVFKGKKKSVRLLLPNQSSSVCFLQTLWWSFCWVFLSKP